MNACTVFCNNTSNRCSGISVHKWEMFTCWWSWMKWVRQMPVEFFLCAPRKPAFEKPALGCGFQEALFWEREENQLGGGCCTHISIHGENVCPGQAKKQKKCSLVEFVCVCFLPRKITLPTHSGQTVVCISRPDWSWIPWLLLTWPQPQMLVNTTASQPVGYASNCVSSFPHIFTQWPHCSVMRPKSSSCAVMLVKSV